MRRLPRPCKLFVVGAVLALTCFAGAAYSRSGGVTGKSGKQGGTCNSCHNEPNGAKTPKVTLQGPTSLDAGALAFYTFRIETDAAITGMNAAVSESDCIMLADPDAGATRAEGNEITHTRTLRPDAGAAVFGFSMTAPPYGGKLTLYAAGNACNNNNQPSGDDSSRTTLEINVDGPPRPPPPEAGPPAKPPTYPAVDAAPPSGYDAGTTNDATPPQDDSGCSIGWADRSTVPAGATMASLVALAALGRGRRRRS
jgi:hypothetical protein